MSVLQAAEGSLASQVGRIAGVIASDSFPTGERAALRRMTCEQPLPLAFYRFAQRHLPEGWERHLEDWVTLVAGIAIMSPRAHRWDRGFGTALSEAGYSEARLERLLAADGDTRRTLLLRAARFLAAKSAAFNWAEAAQLLLTSDEERRERLHQRIARDFYKVVKE